MKKLLLYSSLLMLMISGVSCKKDSDDTPDYYFKFKLDGNWVTYKTVAGEFGPDLGDPTLTDLVVTAWSDDQKDIFSMSIQVDGPNLPTGSYDSDNSAYWATMDWMNHANTADMRSFGIEDEPTMAPSKYTFKITSITDKELRGTFTGNYLYDPWGNDPNDAVRHVTEGEFVTKRIR
jgi:hypothetical protein